MKSIRLFKQALLITAVSSLTLSSAFAMDDEWNNAVDKKDTKQLQKLCEEKLTQNLENEEEFKKWSTITDKLLDKLNQNETDFSDLKDNLNPSQLSLSPNNILPKIDENVIEITDNKKEDILTIVPQKTSKDLWMEDSINDPTKRFDFVIKALWSLYEQGLLPPVAEKKKKGTTSFTLEGVKFTVNLTEFNQKISKLVGKDEYMYKKAIEEIDRVFNKEMNFDIEDLPTPICTEGNKQVSKNWTKSYGLARDHNFSVLHPYYLELGHPTGNRGIIKQIIHKIYTNELEYK